MSQVLYFVSSEQIQDLDLFRRNEIPVLVQSISDLPGIIFPKKHKEAALAVLGWNQDEVKEIPTSEWSIDQLAINWPTDEPKVQRDYEQPSHEWWEYLEIVCQWCQEQQFSWPVVVHYKQERHTPYESGKIHLCFGGSASYQVKVWHHKRDIYYQRFHLWIGELGPQHPQCRNIISRLLTKFLPRIIGEEKGFGQADFIEDEANYLALERTKIGENLSTTRTSIETLQAQLVEAIRKEEELRTALETATNQREQGRDRFKALFNQLKSRGYVKQVRYKDGTISVFTERIIIFSEDICYDIGEFCIKINTKGQDGAVKLYNLSRREEPRHFHHPHVNSHGIPCLGNIKQIVPCYIAKREYLILADILYNYLKSVNIEDSRGANITNWPCFS